MQQFVDEATRKDKILDLLFSNNSNLILQCTQIQHSKLSDHNTNVARLSYNMKPQKIQEKLNFATTVIPDYDTAGADDEDWFRASKLLDMVNWTKELEDKSETEITNKILHEMESAVIKTMHKKRDFEKHGDEKHEDTNNKSFRSANRIPRTVRTHMKRKHELSKGLSSVKV